MEITIEQKEQIKRLKSLKNIGDNLALMLIENEIETQEKLIQLGSYKAWERLMLKEGEYPCLNKLYALEGAIEDLRWHDLSKERKEALKHEYHLFVQERENR
ncbi:MAG: TfoX/Sxy family DNA transformation protein [Prolixibacteraceae bacterium]